MANKPRDGYEDKKAAKYGYEGNIVKIPQPPEYRNKPPVKNPHAMHRTRLRARFRAEGLDSFEDHNVLELLLFFGVPQKDVNEEAHALMEQFGSLSNVFDARYEDLCKVKGISENSATLIKLMPQLFRRYELDKLNEEDVMLNTAELVAQYSAKYFKGVTEEKLYLLCLDPNCRMISFEEISSGTVTSAPINIRLIAELGYKANAASLVLVHNHPSGITAPSKQDTDITIKLIATLKTIGLYLSDHIIITPDEKFFSFRKSEKYRYLF